MCYRKKKVFLSFGHQCFLAKTVSRAHNCNGQQNDEHGTFSENHHPPFVQIIIQLVLLFKNHGSSDQISGSSDLLFKNLSLKISHLIICAHKKIGPPTELQQHIYYQNVEQYKRSRPCAGFHSAKVQKEKSAEADFQRGDL
jgi:hypothetical protein